MSRTGKFVVVPQAGHYLVQRPNGKTLVTRVVDKDKHCSCGGNPKSYCEHIKVVAQYIKDGGEKAPEPKKVTPDQPEKEDNITVCPICEVEVVWAGSYTYPLMWRCPEDSSHYWEWYGEKHNVKAFMSGGRPTGIHAIDSMEKGEYASYLDEVEGFYGYTGNQNEPPQSKNAATQIISAGSGEESSEENQFLQQDVGMGGDKKALYRDHG